MKIEESGLQISFAPETQYTMEPSFRMEPFFRGGARVWQHRILH